jgi:hypothetical protein
VAPDPVADHTRDRGQGRAEIRRLQVTTIAGLHFPHATQAIRIIRRARSLHSHHWRTVTAAALRRNARDSTRVLPLLGITSL